MISTEKYFIKKGFESISHMYYFTKEDNRKEYVENVIDYYLIIDALKDMKNLHNFFEIIENYATQYNYVEGEEHFEEGKERYEREADFEGQTLNTMLELCKLALNSEFCKEEKSKLSIPYGVSDEDFILYKIAEATIKDFYYTYVGGNKKIIEQKCSDFFPLTIHRQARIPLISINIGDFSLKVIVDFYNLSLKFGYHNTCSAATISTYSNLKALVQALIGLNYKTFIN